MELSIILPIYNEETRLPRCLEHLTSYLWNYTHYKFEILCVLNGCTDRSEAIAGRFARLWSQVRIFRLDGKGKGGAVKIGMLSAAGKYRMMMDVDLATPPTEIPHFLEAAASCDLVAGRRPHLYQNPLREFCHMSYKRLASRLTMVSDPQCGFKMFQDRCAEEVFPLVTVSGWGFDVEALYLADRLGFSIMELPVRWEHDSGSKLNPVKDGMQMLRDLFRIRKLHAA